MTGHNRLSAFQPGWASLPARGVFRTFEHLSALILPHRCPVTGDVLATGPGLSPAAWRDLRFLAGPICDLCGRPMDAFAADGQQGLRCAPCDKATPAFNRLRAALCYDDGSRGLIMAFKHGDRTDLAPLLATWMERAATDLMADTDLLIPVPLHRNRMLVRRFNQAGMLARLLGRRSGIAVSHRVLHRTRATPSQGRKSASARMRNVRGAFAVRPDQTARVRGRNVLIIDDVCTTGATLEACAKVLRRAGAARVDALTLARVLRPE